MSEMCVCHAELKSYLLSRGRNVLGQTVKGATCPLQYHYNRNHYYHSW